MLKGRCRKKIIIGIVPKLKIKDSEVIRNLLIKDSEVISNHLIIRIILKLKKKKKN